MSRIYGVKADEVHEYVLKDQRGDKPEDQVRFKVKFLDVIEYAEVQDGVYQISGAGDEREERLVTGTQALQTLILGLRGWANFTYSDGKEVVWKDPDGEKNIEGRRRVMTENLNKIPPKERNEIADYIRGESRLGEEKKQL